VAQDVPGLLARVAGVLFAKRIDILDAAIYSRESVSGHGQDEALDVFRVRKEPDGAVTDERRIASIQADLDAVLSGYASVEVLLARRPRAPSIIDRAKPEVPPTEVRVDNEISPVFTVSTSSPRISRACFTPSREPWPNMAWTSTVRGWAWPATGWLTFSTSGTLPPGKVDRSGAPERAGRCTQACAAGVGGTKGVAGEAERYLRCSKSEGAVAPASS